MIAALNGFKQVTDLNSTHLCGQQTSTKVVVLIHIALSEHKLQTH